MENYFRLLLAISLVCSIFCIHNLHNVAEATRPHNYHKKYPQTNSPDPAAAAAAVAAHKYKDVPSSSPPQGGGGGGGGEDEEPPEPSTSSDIAPANPYPANSCIFNVRDYGAVGDGSSDDTNAFGTAWKEACGVDNSVVLVPSDGVFTITSTIFSGPCKPGITLQVDGILMPPDGPDCWPEKDSKKQWLVFYRLDCMTLTGKGTIEGNGHKWWELPCKPHRGPHGTTLPGPCDSPAMIRFFMSSNLTLSNLRIQNSPQFHVKFDGCQGVLIDKISINSPQFSPNTDGIHVQDTKSVGIYNSMIANGDDCVSIGTGCVDVDIEGVTCEHSHGISIGSLGVQHSEACVSGITVRNTNIRNSDNGVRIKTWQGGSGSVSAITFENIQMENTTNCIIIDQYYCLSKACRNETSAVYLSDVTYKNIKGTYNVKSAPIHFACSDSVPCTNITMSEVELLPAVGELVDDPFCWNAYGAQMSLTIPPIDCLRDGMPEKVIEGVVGCPS